MDRRGFDTFLGWRGQRWISLPASALGIGTDWKGDLHMQTFHRQGFAPQPAPRPTITPVKYQSGAKIGRELLEALRGVDRIAPRKEC